MGVIITLVRVSPTYLGTYLILPTYLKVYLEVYLELELEAPKVFFTESRIRPEWKYLL